MEQRTKDNSSRSPVLRRRLGIAGMGGVVAVWLVLGLICWLVLVAAPLPAALAAAAVWGLWTIRVVRRFGQRGVTLSIEPGAVSLHRRNRSASLRFDDIEWVRFKVRNYAAVGLGVAGGLFGVLFGRLLSPKFRLEVIGYGGTTRLVFVDSFRSGDPINKMVGVLCAALRDQQLAALMRDELVLWTPRLAITPTSLLLLRGPAGDNGTLAPKREILFDDIQSIRIKHGHILVKGKHRRRHLLNYAPMPDGIDAQPGFLNGYSTLMAWLHSHDHWASIQLVRA